MSAFSVGVTGHIDLPKETRHAVAVGIAAALSAVPANFRALTSLAPGADQTFAWVAKAMNAELVFVRPADDIESTIPADNLDDFRALRALARCHAMPFPTANEDAYLAAGDWIAREADLLIAVWDGKVVKAKGGTADIVSRRQSLGLPLTVVWPSGAVRSGRV